MRKSILIILLAIGILLFGGAFFYIRWRRLPDNVDPTKPRICEEFAFNKILDGEPGYGAYMKRDKVFDLDSIRSKASVLGYRVSYKDKVQYPWLANMRVEDFNRIFGYSLFKEDTTLTEGPFTITVKTYDDGFSMVNTFGPNLFLHKIISDEESYSIDLPLLPSLPTQQLIQITQAGRCNFRDDYIKGQVKKILNEIGIDSDWIDSAHVKLYVPARL